MMPVVEPATPPVSAMGIKFWRHRLQTEGRLESALSITPTTSNIGMGAQGRRS
jgi:hypothetical protein